MINQEFLTDSIERVKNLLLFIAFYFFSSWVFLFVTLLFLKLIGHIEYTFTDISYIRVESWLDENEKNAAKLYYYCALGWAVILCVLRVDKLLKGGKND
jgi:hypothetical protein